MKKKATKPIFANNGNDDNVDEADVDDDKKAMSKIMLLR